MQVCACVFVRAPGRTEQFRVFVSLLFIVCLLRFSVTSCDDDDDDEDEEEEHDGNF